MTVSLVSSDGLSTYAASTLTQVANEWQKQSVELSSGVTDHQARVAVSVCGCCTFSFFRLGLVAAPASILPYLNRCLNHRLKWELV